MEEGGGDALPHAHEPWNVITALNLEPYLPAGDTWHILDLAASALLPGYAFAQVANTFTLTAADNITDTGSLELDTPFDIVTFEENGRRYAAVTASGDDGVQILDITDPTSITVAGSINNNSTTGVLLDSARQIAIYENGTNRYAAVTASGDNSVQILDITNPASITAAGSIEDSANTELSGAWGIAVFESEGDHYAAVTASNSDTVQVLNITDPTDISPYGQITDTAGLKLDRPTNIDIFESGSSRYAVVNAYYESGVQILDITGANIVAAGSISDSTAGVLLNGAWDIDVFESGTGLYAAVTAYDYGAVQILDITDPDAITAAGSISNSTAGVLLGGAWDIDVFESGTDLYAAVTAESDNAVQIFDLNDLDNLTLAGSISNSTAGVLLNGAVGIDVFESEGSLYAAVAAAYSNAVQIIKIGGGTSTTIPEGAFITTWETTSADESITIPVNGTFTIDWGDGTVNEDVTDYQTHEYAVDDTYTVAISGGLESINISNATAADAAKLQSIEQWGNIGWTTMNSAFQGATNMVYNADDVPDLSGVTDMSEMFVRSSFNGDISNWDVSGVTNMNSMFGNADSFNQDLNDWDVSGVTTMVNMFADTASFNGNISGWDVSNVLFMSGMFSDTASFNGDISNWNISSALSMVNMFQYATAFNQNLGKWHITLDNNSIDLTDSGTTIGAISPQNDWIVRSGGTYGIGENRDSEKFEISGTSLNVKAGEDYTARTDYVINITSTHTLGTNNYHLVEVTVTGTSIPEGAFATTWKTDSAGESISIPVEVHTSGTLTIDWGDGSTATTVTTSGTQTHPYSTSGEYQVNMTGDLSRIIMDDSTTKTKLISIDQWGDIEWTTMEGAFRGASNMVYNASDAPDLSDVTSMKFMFFQAADFDGDLSGWGVSNVENMVATFYDTSFNGDISGWDVSSVNNMDSMFFSANDFDQDLSSWNTASVTDMSNMFNGATSFTIGISHLGTLQV